MSLRTLFRAVISVFGLIATGVLILNVETLTTRLGFQAVLADIIAPEHGRPSVVWQTLSSTSSLYVALLVVGMTAGVWMDVALKKGGEAKRRIKPPEQAWEACYRKVRAMQRKLAELRDNDVDKVPDELPFEILSLHTSLRALGISTPDRDRGRWPPETYFRENWDYLNCIAPFMRDKHRREARKMAKRYLKTVSLIASPGFQSHLGIGSETPL